MTVTDGSSDGFLPVGLLIGVGVDSDRKPTLAPRNIKNIPYYLNVTEFIQKILARYEIFCDVQWNLKSCSQ